MTRITYKLKNGIYKNKICNTAIEVKKALKILKQSNKIEYYWLSETKETK
jgi:hypothetical protein